MVQTRSQFAKRRSAVRSRLNNIYKKAANYRNVNPILRSTNTSRRVGYVLNAVQKIGSAYKNYRSRKVARMAMNRYLPSDISRYIGRYMS